MSLFCAAVICIALFSSINSALSSLEKISEVNQKLDEVIRRLDTTNQIVDDIMLTSSFEETPNFTASYKQLQSYINSIDMYYTGYGTYYQYRDILNMIDSYGERADLAIENLIRNDIDSSSENYSKLRSIKEYANIEIDNLMINLYNGSDGLRNSIFRQLKVLSFSAPLLMVIITLFISSMVLYFNKRLISPINQLTGIAREISNGSYYDAQVTFEKDNEFNILSETMFMMSRRIKDSIQDVQNRAEMMQRLNEQEIENLKIKSMYNKLELRRLQEQINPHFLFNTLSTLQHTAFLEGASETCDIANSIAKLLRYNLSESNTIVTLENEINSLSHYINIQRHRFRDRITVDIRLPELLPDIMLPSLTLQPFVENCFNHGLENVQHGGRIIITVTDLAESVSIKIWDNGCGMPQKEIEQYYHLFKKSHRNMDYKKIGMLNVVRRLQSFYGVKNVVNITSNLGVQIEISLPRHNTKAGEG